VPVLRGVPFLHGSPKGSIGIHLIQFLVSLHIPIFRHPFKPCHPFLAMVIKTLRRGAFKNEYIKTRDWVTNHGLIKIKTYLTVKIHSVFPTLPLGAFRV
jgi:hypothetical protein